MTTTTDVDVLDVNDDVTSSDSDLNIKLDSLIDVLADQQADQNSQADLIANQTEELKNLIDTMSTNNEDSYSQQLLEYQELKDTAQQLSVQLEGLSETVQKSGEFIEIGSNAIVTYSIFYIPLAVIVFCLWWFFRQFLTDFR